MANAGGITRGKEKDQRGPGHASGTSTGTTPTYTDTTTHAFSASSATIGPAPAPGLAPDSQTAHGYCKAFKPGKAHGTYCTVFTGSNQCNDCCQWGCRIPTNSDKRASISAGGTSAASNHDWQEWTRVIPVGGGWTTGQGPMLDPATCAAGYHQVETNTLRCSSASALLEIRDRVCRMKCSHPSVNCPSGSLKKPGDHYCTDEVCNVGSEHAQDFSTCCVPLQACGDWSCPSGYKNKDSSDHLFCVGATCGNSNLPTDLDTCCAQKCSQLACPGDQYQNKDNDDELVCRDSTCSASDTDTCCLRACLPPADSDEEIQFLVQPDWNTVLLQAHNYPGGTEWQSSPASGSVTWQCNSSAYLGTAEFLCPGSGQHIETRGCDPRCQCDNGTVDHDHCPLPFAKRCGSCFEPDAYHPRDGLLATYEYNGQSYDVSEIRCWARCSHVDCSAFTGYSSTSRPSYYQPKRANDPNDATPVEYCSLERPGSFQMDCKSSCCQHACRTPLPSDTVGYAIEYGTVLRHPTLYPGRTNSNDNYWENEYTLCAMDYHSEYTHGRAEMRCTGGGADAQLRGCIPTCRCTEDNSPWAVLGVAEQDTGKCPGPAKQRCQSCDNVGGGTYDYYPGGTSTSSNGTTEVKCWASCQSISTCKDYAPTSVGAYWVKNSSVTYCDQQKYAHNMCQNCCALGCRKPTVVDNLPYSVPNWTDVLTNETVAFPRPHGAWQQHPDVDCASTPPPGYHPSQSNRPRLRCLGQNIRVSLDGCQPTCNCSQLDINNTQSATLGTIDQSVCNTVGTPGKQACNDCASGDGNYKVISGAASYGETLPSERLCWAHCDASAFLNSGGCNFQDSEGNWFQDLEPPPANNLCSQSEQKYDNQSCRTGCCVQGCRAPADPGYGQDSPFDVNWPLVLHSSQLYPGANSLGVTSWNATWGHGCRAGFFGTPAFECQAQGVTVIATGCTDNCQSIKDDPSLCYSRGYGDPMLAHERRAYFSDDHVAAEPQAGALSPEQCCKKGDQCGGMFLYDGKQNVSVVEGIALRASEYCASRGFGQPIANLTTLVPTSNASEKEAECCELPTCDIGFFDAPKSHTCPGRLDAHDSLQPPTGFVGHSVEGSSKTEDEDVCTTRACDIDPMDLLQCCEQRGVCPNYYEENLEITPDPFQIQTSSYFRKEYQVSAQTVAPAHFDCHRDAVLMEEGLDLWISSDAVLNYCAGRYCNGAIDLGTCCVPYVQHLPFNETVPLTEVVNLTTIQPSNTTTFASTFTLKRFYYCDDAFTPEYFWSAHQAWVACNEYGVYCHGFQFDPTFLIYQANYTVGKHYSVLLSVPVEDIPPAALLSTATPEVPVKSLPAGAPSVSFIVHCAKVDARFVERNLTSGETVYYDEDDEYVTVWLKNNRVMNTSVTTAEDLGAVHPEEEEEEEAPVEAKVNGQSNFKLRMVLPALGETIVGLLANETAVMKTSGNGSNVTTSELPLTADLIHSHAGPHDVSDDVSGLFETDRQFSVSINLDHIGTTAPLVDDVSQRIKLREIFARHLHKRILREQHEAHGLNAMTNDSVVVHVADALYVEAAGAAAEGAVASAALIQETDTSGDDDTTNHTTTDDGGPASWCGLQFKPPDLFFQDVILALACGEAVVLVLLVLFVMRHRILNYSRAVLVGKRQADKKTAAGPKRAKVEKKKTKLPVAANKKRPDKVAASLQEEETSAKGQADLTKPDGRSSESSKSSARGGASSKFGTLSSVSGGGDSNAIRGGSSAFVGGGSAFDGGRPAFGKGSSVFAAGSSAFGSMSKTGAGSSTSGAGSFAVGSKSQTGAGSSAFSAVSAPLAK
eukprot:g10632.t1